MLLTFDAHFRFRRVMRKRIDSRSAAARAVHALAFARTHRCWFEQFERVSHRQHRSVYPHRTQFTGPQQIYELGDLWCYALGALESHHAEVRSAFYLCYFLCTTYTLHAPSMITLAVLCGPCTSCCITLCAARDSAVGVPHKPHDSRMRGVLCALLLYLYPSMITLAVVCGPCTSCCITLCVARDSAVGVPHKPHDSPNERGFILLLRTYSYYLLTYLVT